MAFKNPEPNKFIIACATLLMVQNIFLRTVSRVSKNPLSFAAFFIPVSHSPTAAAQSSKVLPTVTRTAARGLIAALRTADTTRTTTVNPSIIPFKNAAILSVIAFLFMLIRMSSITSITFSDSDPIRSTIE